MRVTDIYVSYLKIVRTFQIIRILIKHGSRELINRSMLGRHIRKRRIRKHKPVYTTQERLRITIEDLGPTYVKFGQILADRPRHPIGTLPQRVEKTPNERPALR